LNKIKSLRLKYRKKSFLQSVADGMATEGDWEILHDYINEPDVPEGTQVIATLWSGNKVWMRVSIRADSVSIIDWYDVPIEVLLDADYPEDLDEEGWFVSDPRHSGLYSRLHGLANRAKKIAQERMKVSFDSEIILSDLSRLNEEYFYSF
jgi:hypothetical protein